MATFRNHIKCHIQCLLFKNNERAFTSFREYLKVIWNRQHFRHSQCREVLSNARRLQKEVVDCEHESLPLQCRTIQRAQHKTPKLR
mmetsp:Transcript_10412/g.18786  ORF Transcript_10412/g.18786 Transcript_10412/m.18786 type:complete len:86 (-) Transcript_10412:2032-2289(-)